MTAFLAGMTMLLFTAFSNASLGAKTPEDEILAKGFSAFMDGNNKAARSYFEEAVRINPKNKAAQNGLEKVKIRLKKLESEERVKNKKLASAKCKEGLGFLKSNDVIGAIDSFHDALDAVPGYGQAERNLKSLRKKTGKVLKSKTFNPSEYAFSLGVLAYLDKDWAKAYRLWSQRKMIEPDNVVMASAAARAENHFKLMMFSEKEEFFRRSARELYQEGYYQKAKESWREVLGIIPGDIEGIEGLASAEKEILRIEGKGRNEEFNALLEQALDDLANQKWADSKAKFIQLSLLDPDFKTANEYITHINNKLSEKQFVPAIAGGRDSWKEAPAPIENAVASVPDEKGNFVERRKRLESLIKRDPANIKAQQELDKIVKEQDDESEKVYKDGLIAYSQGNRDLAIIKWKQVLLINPEHQKAQKALQKARAEQERTATPEGSSQ